MPTLSSSIVKHSVATMREVEDALARQVLYGGDLLTNLLEITPVNEERLLVLLSQLHGLAPAPSGVLPRATADTLRLLPSDVASRHAVYPLEEQSGALVVCVAHPLPEDVESDLSFLLGVQLTQRVAPRARIAQAIARDYGVPLDRRSARIVARLDGEPDPHPSEGPPPIELPLNLADVPRPPSVPPIAFPPATELPSVPPPGPGRDVHEAETHNVPEVALRELVKQSQPPPPPNFPQEKIEIPAPPISLPSPQATLGSGAEASADDAPLDLFGPISEEPETTLHEKAAEPPPSEPEPEPEPTALEAPSETSTGDAGANEAAQAKKPSEENQRTQPSLRVPPLSTEEHHPNVSLHPSARPPGVAEPPEATAEVRPTPIADPSSGARAAAEDDAPPVSIGPSPSERLANLGRDVERWRSADPRPRRRGPYTAAEAEQDLVDAESRDDVLSAFFDYSAQYFDYTALFAVQGDLAEGRNARGPGATTAEVQGIGVPLDLPGILRSAKLAGTPTLQALASEGLDKSLADDLKRPGQTAKLAIPVSVRNHCVLILYVCEGKNDVQLGAAGQVLAFAPLVSQALERVILRRKLAVRREVKRDLPTGLARLAEARKRERVDFKDQPSPEARASALVSALSGAPKQRSSQAPRAGGSTAPAPPQQPDSDTEAPAADADQAQAAAGPPSQRPTALAPSAQQSEAPSEPAPSRSPAPPEAAPLAKSESAEPASPAAPAELIQPAPREPDAQPEAKPVSLAPSRTIVIGPGSDPSEPSPPTITSPEPEQREDSGEQEPIPLSKNKRSRATAVLGSLAQTQESAHAPKAQQDRSSTPPQGTPVSVSQLSRARREVLPPNSRRVPSVLEKQAADEREAKEWEQLSRKKSIPHGSTLNLGSLQPTDEKDVPPTRPSEPPVFPLTRRSGGKMRAAEPIEFEAEHRTDPGIGSQPLPAPTPQEGPEISVSAVDERVSYPDEDFLDEAPLAASSRRMSVAPSVPASRHDSAEIHLPKVIVNESDTHDLVKDLISGNEIAFEAIVEDGKRSLGALLSAFPGPIHAEQKPVGSDGPVKASECGPILKALATIGQDAVGFIAVRTQDRDPVVRGWATRLLGELPCGESARNVGRRVTDKDPDVRRAALAAGRMLLPDEGARSELLRTLIQYANDARQSEDAAHAAIEMMADLREGRAVPALIDLLNSQYTDIAKSAQWALVVLSRQDFAQDQGGWKKWWNANSARHRIEWLIDSLLHEVPEIRRAAGDELKSLTKEYFGYYDDLPRAERTKAQARYREWWESRGKARFR